MMAETQAQLGQWYSVSILHHKSWVQTEENPEQPDYPYCDVLDSSGRILYMQGELCKMVGYDAAQEAVTLYNPDNGEPPFQIPYRQFAADFCRAEI